MDATGSRARAIAIRKRWPKWREQLAAPIAAQKFLQFAFFEQWRELREYARERGVRIMGDLPIYVAHDSADVWVNRRIFSVGRAGQSDGCFRACRRIISARPASFGAIRFIAGTRWRGMVTAGGWIDFAPRSRWWT